MTDTRHSLKRGDRLSKNERQTTASDWEKATNCDLCYGSKVTATFVTIKQATKQQKATKLVTSDLGYTLGGPHYTSLHHKNIIYTYVNPSQVAMCLDMP
jgi:hypothetical protein